ncbi:MAG: alpha/beta hydrolase [Caldilineaceae bacterium]
MSNHPTIYHEEHGAGPPLILLHGLGGSRRWWRKNIDAFAPHFTVYCVDLIGFGRSKGTRRFVLTEAATAIHEWMHQHDLTQAALVGHSMGGRIGAELAVDFPGTIDRLVLVDTPILPFGHGYARQSVGMLEALRTVPFDLLRVLVADTLRTGPFTTLQIGRELLRSDIARKLAKLQTETLIVWGERDTVVPHRLAHELAAQLPQSQLLILPNTGHVPMWERPEAFNRAVLEFLR